ncbi:hypothetical protein ABB02_00210 [Clostridiaceae bacterium JG1575]|nr:hypothetical protein ABB02_00210 [Clostridiaceae bacterium JG1575]
MNAFPDEERFTQILTECADELPDGLFDQLNLGIHVSPMVRTSEASQPQQALYVLGEYRKDAMGRSIVIYYGSFARLFSHLSEEALRSRMRETLRHELRHHLEHQGGEYDLEWEDHLQMEEYRARLQKK